MTKFQRIVLEELRYIQSALDETRQIIREILHLAEKPEAAARMGSPSDQN